MVTAGFADYGHTAAMYRRCRRAGETVRTTTDCLSRPWRFEPESLCCRSIGTSTPSPDSPVPDAIEPCALSIQQRAALRKHLRCPQL